MISPVTAANDSRSGTDPRIGWVKSFGRNIEGGIVFHHCCKRWGCGSLRKYTISTGISGHYIVKMDTNGNKLWDDDERQ